MQIRPITPVGYNNQPSFGTTTASMEGFFEREKGKLFYRSIEDARQIAQDMLTLRNHPSATVDYEYGNILISQKGKPMKILLANLNAISEAAKKL